MATSDKGKIAAPRKKREAWTEEKVAILIKAIKEGKSYKEAFTKARISERAFYNHLRDDVQFKQAVKSAEAEFNEYFDANIVTICKRSLSELICGYEWDEVTTETIPDKNGKKIIKRKVVHKKAAPNTTAVIFALCNRDPEHWQNRINNEISGKVETETKQNISLANVPDELLGQLINAINGK